MYQVSHFFQWTLSLDNPSDSSLQRGIPRFQGPNSSGLGLGDLCRLAGRPCAPIGLGFQCPDGVELWWSAFGGDGVAGREGLVLRDVAFFQEPGFFKRFHGKSLRRCYPNPWETLKSFKNLNVLYFRRFPQISQAACSYELWSWPNDSFFFTMFFW